MAGLIPSATTNAMGLASIEMANTVPSNRATNERDSYIELFNHPVSFSGVFLLLSGFQDSDLKRSVSIVYCKSHTSLQSPVVIPLYGGSDRLGIYGKLENGVCRYCVSVPSAYMHIQSVSLHPKGVGRAFLVSDISSWTKLI